MQKYEAVFFDFGGVITQSPFDKFNDLESELKIEKNFIRRHNAHNADNNAWAKYERNEVSAEEFDKLFFEETSAEGTAVPGHKVREALKVDIRPNMVKLLHTLKAKGYRIACLTNNTIPSAEAAQQSDAAFQATQAMKIFEQVIESSLEGVRKPEESFYLRALDKMQVKAAQVVFLDDLGINLKPAKGLGMTTIKVLNESQAIRDLEATLSIKLI